MPVNAPQARLLVVDDDFSFLTFACAVIEQMRLRADVAMSGADALRRLDAESFAGVLLDLRLPDIDGLEVLREVRTGGNEVPVVILTGAGTIPTAVEAMRLGVETFIEKPIPRHVLMRTVELLVAGERRSLNERTNERTNLGLVSPLPPSERILLLARVVANFVRSPSDVRTVEELCRASGVYVAPRTFRGWCTSVGVQASALLDLARLMRAVNLSALGGQHLRGCLEADERTVRALCDRGFPGVGATEVPIDLSEFLNRQQFISSEPLLRAILSQLKSDQNHQTPS